MPRHPALGRITTNLVHERFMNARCGAPSVAATSQLRHVACVRVRMQFDEHELRLEVRRRMADGRLPREPQLHLWAGTGDGQLCSLCDRVIDSQQIEYEL